MSSLLTRESSKDQIILARMSRDSARKVLQVTIMLVGVVINVDHPWKVGARVGQMVVLRAGVKTYFEPIQFRDPVENGLKASFSSLSKRDSYRGWVAGSQRSGWNISGSTQLVGELEAASAGIEIVA